MKALILSAEPTVGTKPDMDAALAVPRVCAAHSTLLALSLFVLRVNEVRGRRGLPRPNVLCEQHAHVDEG